MRINTKRFRWIVLGLCVIAVVIGWLGIRLWKTYLPEPVNDLANLYSDVDPNVVTVRRAAGELETLQEQVRKTVPAVLPSVVAVTTPDPNPSAPGRYQSNYGSGVIITADGIVLSQWHISHWKKSESGDERNQASRASFLAGDKTTVILHDGRECRAELLGANRSHDISLLRLLEPGPFPHVPVDTTTSIQVGDWVLKIGHPLGYRNGRSAPVRLGRVICGTDEIFGTDCMWSGGDSGGPYFNLDGQLLGIMRNSPLQEVMRPDASFVKRTNGYGLMRVTGSKLIHSLLDAMIRGEITQDEMTERSRIEHELATSALSHQRTWVYGFEFNSGVVNLHLPIHPSLC
jgi:S1-C subfamily serine protease